MRHSAWNRCMGVSLVLLWTAVVASLVGCGARRGPEEPTLLPVSREPVTIRAITFSEEEDYTRVTIEGSRELIYESLELLEAPLRISVEIPNASLEVVTPIYVGDGTVTEIIATTDDDSGRVDIGLVERVPYNITQEANSLFIDIEKVKATKPIRAVQPAVVKEVGALTTMRPAKVLTGVTVAKQNDITEVTLTADGVIGDYDVFTLESPPRLVIDLWALKNTFPQNAVSAETPHLKRVRIGVHSKKTRLVLDASGATLPRYRIDRFQNELVVALGAVDSIKRGVRGELASVDFKQIDDKSRVVLSTSEKVDYEIFKVSQEDVVIDLKNTTTPEHLKRVLDTRAFDSAVESIRLYNVRSETSRDVRVVIHLREMVDFEAFQEDERIYVDFQRSQTVRADESGMAPPRLVSEPKRSQEVAATEEEMVQAMTEEEEEVETQPSYPAVVGEEVVTTEAPLSEAEAEAPVTVQLAEKKKKEAVKEAKPETEAATPQLAAKEEESFYEFGLVPGKEYTGRRLSLDFKDAEIKNILRLIAEVSELNIVAGDDVKGKVTIRLIDVPWDQALDIILFSNNLGKMRMGNVIRVAPVDVLKREQEEVLTSKRTKEKLEDLVTELIPVNYSTVQELQIQVKNILSDRGTVSVDTRTNTLIIKDIPKVVAEARDLVESLDTKTPQVVIEARIVEASTNFARDLGIQWGGNLGPTQIGGETSAIQVSGGIGTDTVGNFPVEGATSAITFNLTNLGDITNLDIELSALETAGEAEIISAPRITTLDNKEAHIEQGLRIPYLKLTAEGTATTEFIEANINLTVTPHVTNDGHVKMEIKAAKDSPDDSITVQGVPAIDKKEAITEVLVEDGDVVVIGGLYSIEKADLVSRVPLLGKVPILGFFFRRTEIEDQRRDLLIFISPRIIQEKL